MRKLMPAVITCCLFFDVLAQAAKVQADAQTNDAPKQDRAGDAAKLKKDANKENQKKLLETMRQRAAAAKVYQLKDKKRIETKLVAKPLFRYSDQPRGILDATLWAWGPSQGRPAALLKMESYRTHWLHCMVSFSDGLIEAEWIGGRRFSAKKPGLKLHPLPRGPRPADSQTGRLRQIKELARRFSATIRIRDAGMQEMRRLSRPVYRYSDPDSGLNNGAIFAFAANGTNPDAFLLIELHQKGPSPATWHYGLTKMTASRLAVRLDKEVVFEAEFSGPGKHANWHYFTIGKSERDVKRLKNDGKSSK